MDCRWIRCYLLSSQTSSASRCTKRKNPPPMDSVPTASYLIWRYSQPNSASAGVADRGHKQKHNRLNHIHIASRTWHVYNVEVFTSLRRSVWTQYRVNVQSGSRHTKNQFHLFGSFAPQYTNVQTHAHTQA